MSTAGWEAFARYATWVHGNPAWEAGERTPRLAIAAGLRDSVAAASGGSGWQEAFARCLYSPGYWRVDLTLRGQDLWFWPWLKSGDPRLREAVAGFGRPDVAPRERFAAFADAAASAHREGLIKDAPGSVIAFGSLLNFAMEPERLPFVLKGPYSVLERLLSGGNAQDGSVTDEYERHLNFGAEVADFLRGTLPAADMLDVHALILNASRNAAFWSTGLEVGPDASPPRREPPHYLAVCAIYRDEGSYMREWIEFHRLVGVERFFLYDNRSSDDHREVLAPYVERGEVVVHEVADHDWSPETPQLAAYQHCIDEHAGEARWIAFIDLDEFLFSPTGRPLPEVLRRYERWPGVGVNWAMFGTSGHLTRPPGLVTESYLDRLSEATESHCFKSVVDPARVTSAGARVHKFMFTELGTVDENQYPIAGPFTKTVSRARLQINHYSTKSLEEHRVRSQRARPAAAGLSDPMPVRRPFDPELLAMREELAERDEAILQFAPALRAALDRASP